MSAAGHLSSFLKWLGFCQRRCANCLQPFYPDDQKDGRRLCASCRIALSSYQGPRCRRCGIPSQNICRQCASTPPPWPAVAYHGLYTGALREMILRLKFGNELHIARLLAEFVYEAARCLPRPEAIVPIPQAPQHLRNRGFNQAHEIGRYLAKLAGFRLDSNLLERTRQCRPQEGLSAEERKENLAGAFRASPDAAGKAIWLLDDVMTTGSTCASAACELLDAGASAVYPLFVARTPLA